MTFGTTAAAVLASLAIVNAPAAAAYAAQLASLPTGHDVSYPQYGQALPSGQAFGIVAVNDGLANTTNPCLADEIAWAQTSSGAARQPKDSLYVNTADPGTVPVTSPLYRLPNWRPGARTLSQAEKNCRLAPLTGGGSVSIAKWKTRSAGSDLSCRTLPQKAPTRR